MDVLGVLRDEVLPALAVGLGLEVGVFVFFAFAFFRLLVLDEVGEGAVFGLGVAGDVNVELFFSAGEGDVEQAEVFGALFGLVLLLVAVGELGFVEELGLIFLVDDLPFGGLLAAGFPCEWAVYDGVLQPFGGVHGYDFDEVFVAF